jgi:hypothetical protein
MVAAAAPQVTNAREVARGSLLCQETNLKYASIPMPGDTRPACYLFLISMPGALKIVLCSLSQYR